ncbi:MAG: hypothetical protein HKN26_01095 [Acidimicrobiales bacterium]|nr:hypothetical protein [Acidimicrobiales bacterium]
MDNRRAQLVSIFAAFLLLATACDVQTIISAPRHGSIADGPSIATSGTVNLASYGAGGTLTVNGIATPVNPDGTWSQSVNRVAGYVTPITATYVNQQGQDFRHRTAVVNGPSIPAGSPSPDGVGMVFTANGLTGLGPVVENLAGGSFDIGALLQAQNPILEDEPLFLTFEADGSVYEAGIGNVDISAAAAANGVDLTVDVHDLYVGLDLDITDNLLINASCALELQVDVTTIDATFDLEPEPAGGVDVNQIGTLSVDLGTVDYEFISGICDGDTFVIGDIVNALTPDIEAVVAGGFTEALGDPDGTGPADSPLAEAIETSLAGIDIAGELSEAIGVNLDAGFTSITESTSGIEMLADADFFASIGAGPTDCLPPPGSPLLESTYDVPTPFSSLGSTTPSGDPFGLGVTISASAFNQLLGALTECGLTNTDISELAGDPPLPLNTALLSTIIPSFSVFQDVYPVTIQVRPTTAPFLTDQPGPNGEMAELVMANLMVTFMVQGPNQALPYLSVAIDAPLGFDLTFDPATNQLAPVITPGPIGSASARVITNYMGADESELEAIFPNLFPLFAGELSGAFGAFPLPSLLGLDISVIETARQGDYFNLYANLTPDPQAEITNLTITDTSSSDTVTDSLFDVNEWRHRIRPSNNSTSASIDLKGMIGADACCSVDDEQITAGAGYTVSFDVQPVAGETWQVAIDHSMLGAHTIINEDNGGAQTRFDSPITGRARVDAGAWQDFSFNVSQSSASTSVGNSGSDVLVEFSGSNGLLLTGTSAATITIEIDFDLFARSESNVIFPIAAGDEAAIRFGANDTIANGFTAGGYPGLGNRSIVTDGHFLDIALSSA